MDLKAVIAVFFYYLIMASVWHFGVSHLSDSSISAIAQPDLSYSENLTNPSYNEGVSGFFQRIGAALNSIGQLLGFMFFGIGLPSNTPSWFSWIFSGIFTLITIICLVIVINSFWGGSGPK